MLQPDAIGESVAQQMFYRLGPLGEEPVLLDRHDQVTARAHSLGDLLSNPHRVAGFGQTKRQE